jgi:hypothetical protein
MKTLKYTSLAVAVLVLAVTPAFAGTITIYGTGAANNASGQPDLNYQLVSAPNGVTFPAQAYTTDGFGPWLIPPPGLWWDNPFDQPANGPKGTYQYQTSFDLTGFLPATAVLTGVAGADDQGEIYLNGVDTGVTLLGFVAPTPFTITDGMNGAHFQNGVNTLDFMVYNTLQLEQSPTGLFVEITGTANPTPELGTLGLLGTGVLGLGGMLRRRLRG